MLSRVLLKTVILLMRITFMMMVTAIAIRVVVQQNQNKKITCN